METYLVLLGFLGVFAAMFIGVLALIQIHQSTRDIHKTTENIHRTTEASLRGIEELIHMSRDERRRSETLLKMAEATLRELLELRQHTPQVH
jgi:hypothetical protein